ncbi:MAG: hypothetical protein RI580_07815 [Halothece sp. Uz-M2-17]|nr:hypothetical protein [Halothece sp. Uz-M2-17]
MKKLNRILSPIAGTTFALLGLTVQPASAITPPNNIIDFKTAPDGTTLDPLKLDEPNGQQIDIDGDGTKETVSTSVGNVGDIYQQFGLTVTSSIKTIGLFDSSCPSGGCGDPKSDGFSQSDPDLETGPGAGPGGSDTEPQGNLLIIEENAGDDFPDDQGTGGSMTLDFDETQFIVKIDKLTFVDDISNGEIVFTFADQSSTTQNFSGQDDNDVFDLTLQDGTGPNENYRDKQVDQIDITFGSSGGVGALAFTEYRQVPFEAETSFGVLIAAGYGLYRYYKHKKVASIKQETEE